uniref:Uncharacterized protein n=1 Tax=Oryza sativa subsp. japonica TaxID=39947 RepID=Q67WC3_ORYSJ|nr:hypothetical protein [Oryza sativa Japonica Group]BAD37546.1 hypothetical protein [Oryza sativa Japonica Group]
MQNQQAVRSCTAMFVTSHARNPFEEMTDRTSNPGVSQDQPFRFKNHEPPPIKQETRREQRKTPTSSTPTTRSTKHLTGDSDRGSARIKEETHLEEITEQSTTTPPPPPARRLSTPTSAGCKNSRDGQCERNAEEARESELAARI